MANTGTAVTARARGLPPGGQPACCPLTTDAPRALPWLRRGAQVVGLLAVFTIAVLAVVYSDQVQERFAGLGYLAVFVITIVAAATVILPAPGAVSVAAFGAALDPWLVGLVAATGQTIGELSGYYIGWSGAGWCRTCAATRQSSVGWIGMGWRRSSC